MRFIFPHILLEREQDDLLPTFIPWRGRAAALDAAADSMPRTVAQVVVAAPPGGAAATGALVAAKATPPAGAAAAARAAPGRLRSRRCWAFAGAGSAAIAIAALVAVAVLATPAHCQHNSSSTVTTPSSSSSGANTTTSSSSNNSTIPAPVAKNEAGQQAFKPAHSWHRRSIILVRVDGAVVCWASRRTAPRARRLGVAVAAASPPSLAGVPPSPSPAPARPAPRGVLLTAQTRLCVQLPPLRAGGLLTPPQPSTPPSRPPPTHSLATASPRWAPRTTRAGAR